MSDFPYSIVIVPDTEDGGFYAYIPDLQGCMGDGKSPQDAASDVISAAECWIEAQSERGGEIPQPGFEAAQVDSMMEERESYIAKLENELSDARKEIRRLKSEKSIRVGTKRRTSHWTVTAA